MTPIVRVAVPSDDRALAVLDARSWPPQLQVVPAQPASEPFFGPRRRPADVLVAVDDADGTLLGYLRLGRHLPIPSNDHVLHIEALVVADAARGHGVGGQLVAAGVAQAQARGVRKLGLRALSNNERALALYARHGFVEEGRLRAELRRPDGSYADDVWLARWLVEPPG